MPIEALLRNVRPFTSPTSYVEWSGGRRSSLRPLRRVRSDSEVLGKRIDVMRGSTPLRSPTPLTHATALLVPSPPAATRASSPIPGRASAASATSPLGPKETTRTDSGCAEQAGQPGRHVAVGASGGIQNNGDHYCVYIAVRRRTSASDNARDWWRCRSWCAAVGDIARRTRRCPRRTRLFA